MYYEQYNGVTWFVVPCYILIILVGTFGNVVVLRAYMSRRTVMSQPYNLILSNGVVADLIICAIFTPLLLFYRANEPAHWIEYSPLCEVSVFSSMLAVSIQYIVFPLLSLNRKDLVFQPTFPWLSERRCKKLLIAGWLVCIGASLVTVALVHHSVATDDTPKLYRCILAANTNGNTFTIFFLGYSIPLYVISIAIAAHCYTRIHLAVSHASPSDSVLSDDDVRRTKMCMIVAIVYTLFWCPFLLVQFYGLLVHYSEFVFNCHALASVLGVLASAVNPYIYSFMDHYYRKKFRNIFGSRVSVVSQIGVQPAN